MGYKTPLFATLPEREDDIQAAQAPHLIPTVLSAAFSYGRQIAPAMPKVLTCIRPTADRHACVAQAL